MPTVDATAGQVLKNDGSGNMSWGQGCQGGGFATGTLATSTINVVGSLVLIEAAAATAPTCTGQTYRALVHYEVFFTNFTTEADCQVTDGTNIFAPCALLPSAVGTCKGSGISPTTYASGTVNTFTVKCISTAGGATATKALGLESVNTSVNALYVPSS